MGKETDLIKAVKNNDKSKLQKLFLPEGDFRVRKANTSSGGIRLRLHHINVDCHEPKTGSTPLILAVLQGHKDVAESLVFHAADVDATDNKGNTALHIAAFTERSDLVEMLLRNKAKIDVSNSDGNTPLHIACQNYNSHNVLLIVKLLEADADASILNKQRFSPLDLAAMFNRKDAVSALLDHTPSLRENTQAIVEASIRGHTQIVEILLDYGCDPNGMDPIKQTGALHEAVRFLRIAVVKILLEFGARVDRLSGDLQSPEMIAQGLPSSKCAEFTGLFKEYSQKPRRKPRFLHEVIVTDTLVNLHHKDYPLLPQCVDWTENSPDYCNNCTASNPNTNLLDGDLQTFWVIPSKHHAWTAFDLGCSHTLTGVRIWGWDSVQMAKIIEIQKSKSIHGPWTSVYDFTCLRKGSTSPNEPGTAQDFQMFTDQSRYWRILVVENHGGSCTCFQGVQFYGADDRIAEHLEKYELQTITDKIIEQGYNTFDRFVTAPSEELRKLVSGVSRIEELIIELSHLRLLVHPFTQLAWLQSPVSIATEGECIPEFSVQSDPEITEKVELVFSGCEVKGTTQTSLLPSGSKLPSVATFNNITFCSAGVIDLSVRSIRYPHITLQQSHRIEISSKIKTEEDIAAAFGDIEAMLHEARISLESPKEEFSVPEIIWS